MLRRTHEPHPATRPRPDRPPFRDSASRGDRPPSATPGCTIASLDLYGKTATDDAGETHSYEKLLLATGGTPRRVADWDEASRTREAWFAADGLHLSSGGAVGLARFLRPLVLAWSCAARCDRRLTPDE